MVAAPSPRSTLTLLAGALIAIVLTCSTLSSAEEVEACKDYLAWLNGRNVTVADSLAADGAAHGCVALSNISAGDQLVHVPPESVLTTSLVMSSHINRTIVAMRLPLQPEVVLALFLVEAKYNDSSPWAAYARQLPTEFSTTIFFTDDELLELQGSPLLASTLQRKELIVTEFNAIKAALAKVDAADNAFAKEGVLTLESFIWALSIVWSQGIQVTFPETTQPVIIPVVERFAVSNYATASVFFDEKSRGFKVSAIANLAKDDAVVLNMGRKANTALLLDYGRMDDHNPFDYVTVRIRMAPENPFTELKEKMLNQLGMSMNSTYYLSNEHAEIPRNLLTMTRVQMMRPSEFDQFENVLAQHGSGAGDGGPSERRKNIVSLWNELMTMRTIMGVCDHLLEKYNSSLAEDENIHADLIEKEKMEFAAGAVDSEHRRAQVRRTQAVALRMSEKRILLRTKTRAQQLWLELLKVDLKGLE